MSVFSTQAIVNQLADMANLREDDAVAAVALDLIVKNAAQINKSSAVAKLANGIFPLLTDARTMLALSSLELYSTEVVSAAVAVQRDSGNQFAKDIYTNRIAQSIPENQNSPVLSRLLSSLIESELEARSVALEIKASLGNILANPDAIGKLVSLFRSAVQTARGSAIVFTSGMANFSETEYAENLARADRHAKELLVEMKKFLQLARDNYKVTEQTQHCARLVQGGARAMHAAMTAQSGANGRGDDNDDDDGGGGLSDATIMAIVQFAFVPNVVYFFVSFVLSTIWGSIETWSNTWKEGVDLRRTAINAAIARGEIGTYIPSTLNETTILERHWYGYGFHSYTGEYEATLPSVSVAYASGGQRLESFVDYFNSIEAIGPDFLSESARRFVLLFLFCWVSTQAAFFIYSRRRDGVVATKENVDAIADVVATEPSAPRLSRARSPPRLRLKQEPRARSPSPPEPIIVSRR